MNIFTSLIRKTLMFSLLIMTHVLSVHAQWTVSNYPVTLNNLNDVTACGSTDYVTVGDAGTILRSSDNGDNWTKITSGTGNNLNGISISPASTSVFYAVGDNGTILKSNDRGVSWFALNSGVTSNLRAIAFSTANVGIAVGDGGMIVRTGDGGTTWAVRNSGGTGDLYGVTANTTYFYAWGYNRLLKSSDGGFNYGTRGLENFNAFALRVAANTSVMSIYQYSSSTNKFIRSTDNTSSIPEMGSSSYAMRDMAFATNFGDITGYAVGDAGSIYKTTNDGVSWAPTSTSGVSVNLKAVASPTTANAIAAGDNGVILSTPNGAVNWYRQNSTPTFIGVSFPNSTYGWGVGFGGIVLRTTSGGINWYDPVQTKNVVGAGQDLFDVHFVDNSTGYIVGSSAGAGFIAKSTTGGDTWGAQNAGTSSVLFDVEFDKTSQSTGWVVGDAGVIRKTTDGGSNWGAQTSGTTQTLLGLSVVDANTAYSVGGNGVIIKTTNGGSAWTTQSSGTTAALHSVQFVNASTGWAVGDNGTILKTINGGTNWVAQNSTVTAGLRGVYFSNALSGYAVGLGGAIVKTTNGGTNWSAEISPTSLDLTDIALGYIAGANNIVLVNSIVLPLNLLSFSISGSDCNLGDLQWTTANEQGAGYFEVQTSADGNRFYTAGKLMATNSGKEHAYSYPLPYSGTSFARLKMTDKDGQYTYSKIITIQSPCKVTGFTWSLSPNPLYGGGKLQMNLKQYANDGPLQVELFDAQGVRHVKSVITPTPDSNLYATTIEMPQALPAGVYIIRISNSKFSDNKRIVIGK